MWRQNLLKHNQQRPLGFLWNGDGPDAKYVYRTDITMDTVSHILSAPVTVSSKQVLTRYLEKDTNKVLSPEEKGRKDKKDIPDYTFVETKVDGNVNNTLLR